MALACNMLVAHRRRPPEINTAAPSYPGKLPLDVHPELTVQLSALNKDALDAFLEIERPDHPGHRLAMNAEQDLEADRRSRGQRRPHDRRALRPDPRGVQANATRAVARTARSPARWPGW